MKVCPECRTKNDDLTNFCKKCGLVLAGPAFKDKREKVLGNEKKSPWVLISLGVIVVVLGGVAFWILEAKTTTNPRIASQQKVMDRVNYSGQTIPMTDIVARVQNGKIVIPLEVVKEKKMVRFEYEGNGVKVPLLAYVTLAGKVVTAISMCEPCRSTRFHIQDQALVCNACNTEWSLETLKGISGGCMNYPPEVIPSTVERDSILIEEKVVVGWKPRA
ncbi:MAG TPA: DUF2318 domain-containing protein [Thermodesulfobacteriota bacterium]|nr:DUF2318 domain-containing protein [Thermodesulfobacteriota bacterium]